MADVFLSCARTNLGAAQRVAALLRACGFSVWYDESLPAHRAFSDVIEEQLEAASSVLVLWSTEAVASQWVRSEANRGREKHRLVQVRLDDARLPMPFDQLQCVDLRNWNNKPDTAAWESVVASVAELAGREASGGGAVPRHLPPQGTSRRQMLVGGGVVAGLGALGGAAWLLRDRPKMSPEAQMVLQKGLDSLQQNDALETQDPGSTLTAIALLSDATQLAPDSAVAWGGLAMAYAVRKRVVPPGERRGVDARSRAAAKAALELDPREGRATGALRMLEAPYRNWIAVERGHRAALQRNPTFPILLFTMSDLLGHVGRWQEARQYSDRFDRKRFMLPGADRKVIINLWAAGDLPAADRMLDVAVKQWPQHPQIFRTRLSYLMFTGRPGEALEILGRTADWPIEIRPDFIAAIRATAEALAGKRPPEQARRTALEYLEGNPSAALQVAQACVALGDAAAAFALLRGYYFGEGEWKALAPAGGDEDRVTSPLFQPMMRPMWRERSFDDLLDRIGLNDYWRQTGTVPDFRR
ncbi:TIR domain-containing protein [Sphingomonas lutea]|uniref:TIR domain-containing protein n=1 Tax=Sphingomonas lutea TaxID=1045317 RepID=UPI001F204116|nr:TIR domain-containing protein [Sphingomonas lutea]